MQFHYIDLVCHHYLFEIIKNRFTIFHHSLSLENQHVAFGSHFFFITKTEFISQSIYINYRIISRQTVDQICEFIGVHRFSNDVFDIINQNNIGMALLYLTIISPLAALLDALAGPSKMRPTPFFSGMVRDTFIYLFIYSAEGKNLMSQL